MLLVLIERAQKAKVFKNSEQVMDLEPLNEQNLSKNFYQNLLINLFQIHLRYNFLSEIFFIGVPPTTKSTYQYLLKV